MASAGGVGWSDAKDVNQAHWNDLATVHGEDRYYDAKALLRGEDSLVEEEDAAVRAAVGDVAGLDVLHIQCHIGFDSISLARRGARVTGVDFSRAALAKAASLAVRCGVQVEWVEGDATALPEQLAGRFDLAYATIGVLSWIHDMEPWMTSAYSTLRPGGRLVVVETHPLAQMIDNWDPLTVDMPYANDGGHRFDAGSYANTEAVIENESSVVYAHSLGEVVTAAVRAGFRIDALSEHLDTSFQEREMGSLEGDGRWRLRLQGHPLPLLFTLLATRPG